MPSSFTRVQDRSKLLFARIAYPRFYKLKKQAQGMLMPDVYKKMYEYCTDLPDLDIIEIGGAGGAGSIACAWALKETKKKSKLIVVEKCEGGSRSHFGSYDDNLQLLKKHFKKFHVQDYIELYPHELTFEHGKEVISMVRTKEIAALIHDADGRLDRDFFLFWPLLRPGGLIIIDDYENKPKYQPVSSQYPQGGIKLVVTYRLVNQLVEWGLLSIKEKKGATIFGFKPEDGDISKLDLKVCEQIIKQVEQERDQVIA